MSNDPIEANDAVFMKECKNLDDFLKEIDNLPNTVIPMILSKLVERGQRGVFKSGQIHVFVKSVEDKLNG